MLEIDEYKPKIIKAIEYHYPNAKIYLFGSWATGKNRSYSDIDLAIDAGEPIDLYELVRIKKTIDNLDFPHSFDIVDLQSIEGDFKRMVLNEMIPWKE